ncbi:hypothetical protein KAB87_004104 [Salmonella enterica]|nr:hypothetical protein [Salmonella enterica]
MFKDKISAVVGFVKEKTSPAMLASSAVASVAVLASPAFAADPLPFSLTSTMIDPIIAALSANFGVALASAFGLLAVTLVGKAAFGVVKGMISRAL